MISVDTDAPVPEFVGRLRIDLFDEDGTWFESRDIARTNLADWPASFSLYTLDPVRARTVMLRVRGYLEGRVRDYRGERFSDPRPYVEPRVANTLLELCQDLPDITLGEELTLRRGRRTLTQHLPESRPADAPNTWTPQCIHEMAGGVVATRLRIPETDTYRIETTRVRPVPWIAGDVNLFIRTDCADEQSQIACADDIVAGKTEFFPENYLARIVARLERGSYTVLAGGYYPAPADITLRATRAERWDEWPESEPMEPPIAGRPRLITEGRDVTPEREPQPLVTIDRLALITVVPGQKRLASLMLHSACAGRMAKLSHRASNADAVPGEAETCVGAEGESVRLSEERLEPFTEDPRESQAGTFGVGAPCPENDDSGDVVCIPGGAFVLGSIDGSHTYPFSTVPERFAAVRRFWLDKTEVTVGRFREAIRQGLENPSKTPIENNEAFATSSQDEDSRQCTFSSVPREDEESREDMPLNCVDWYAARAFCRFVGGDLPTEAQWRYAATKAGRPFETVFPWGDPDEAIDCDRAVFYRTDEPGFDACLEKGFGPVKVTDSAVRKDATPLGVLGLGGNVAEWLRDSFEPLGSPCWRAATVVEPQCWEENAVERSVAGGFWTGQQIFLGSSSRLGTEPLGSNGEFQDNIGGSEVGFRCAYQEPQ